MNTPNKNKNLEITIKILSVAIPLVVALLFGLKAKFDLGSWTSYLPHLNGLLNSITAFCLALALFFIKRNNITAHRNTMYVAFSLGAVFLVSYVLYHSSNESTPFGGIGTIRYFYFFLLITHVLLSFAVVPLVLYSILHAINGEVVKHKKLVKFTWPIWFYVSVSGVLVYLMISPYYTYN